ncbi:MAG: L-rhamnose/proton symporter RhaT, partial [Planctomycetota bacterium]|nr:L-rhamnose/proton symporter RhaT [Planctomycetota bacterium]
MGRFFSTRCRIAGGWLRECEVIMPTDPFLGVMLHAVGSLAAGSFYAPLRKVRQWAWESFWLVMGLAAWVVAP